MTMPDRPTVPRFRFPRDLIIPECRIEDDRGATRIMDTSARKRSESWQRAWEERHEDLLRLIRHEKDRMGSILVLAWIIVLALPAVLPFVPGSWLTKGGLWLVAFAVTTWVVVVAIANRGRHSMAAFARCIGHCPCCALDLSDASSDQDGATVCPQCGGAWKVDVVEHDPSKPRARDVRFAVTDHHGVCSNVEIRTLVDPRLYTKTRPRTFIPDAPRSIKQMLVGLTPLVCLGLMVAWFFLRPPASGSVWSVLAAVVAVAAAIFLVMRRLVERVTPRQHVVRALRAGLCPVCTYEMRGLQPADKFGLTRCPECGAAWRLGGTGDSPSE